MDHSRLKLNADKTQFIWLGTRQQLDKIDIKEIPLQSVVVDIDNEVKNLGVILDTQLSLSNQVSSLSKLCFFHLR